jgi:hypothetical protein
MNTSEKKVKTACRIIKKETAKTKEADKILQLQLEGRNINNPKEIASVFNNCFTSIAEN